MLNFPVAGGTSGHFLGAALAAILLGPWLACLVMAVVLGVQAFVFADGGITALGANVLNMGVVGALLVGGLMLLARGVIGRGRTELLTISGVGAWLAVMAGGAPPALGGGRFRGASPGAGGAPGLRGGMPFWVGGGGGPPPGGGRGARPGPVPLGRVLPAWLGVHMLIGMGEAVVPVAAVSAVLATRPDLLPGVATEPAKPVLAGAR